MLLMTRAVGAVATVVLTAGGVVALGQPVPAAQVPGCVASHLRVIRHGVQGATSHRYVEFRITNAGAHACRLFGYPTFRYRDAEGKPMGFASTPAGVPAHVVVLAPGQHTRTVLGYVVPAVTLPRQCHAGWATSVTFRLASRPHVFQRPLRARVCTTRKYRPAAYPVGF